MQKKKMALSTLIQQWVLNIEHRETKQKKKIYTTVNFNSCVIFIYYFQSFPLFYSIPPFLGPQLPPFLPPSLFVSPPALQGFRCQSVSVWGGLRLAAPWHTGATGWHTPAIPLHPHTAAAQWHVGSGRAAELEVSDGWRGSERESMGGREGVLVKLLKLLAVMSWRRYMV